MDTFEYEDQQEQEIAPCEYVPEPEAEEPAPEAPVDPESPVFEDYAAPEEPQPEPLRRKRISPYADSPYVLNHPQGEYHSVRQKPAKVKKASGSLWPRVLAGLVAAALICSCGMGFYAMNSQLKKSNEMISSLNQRIQELEQAARQPQTQTAPVQGLPAATGGYTPAQVYAANVKSVVSIAVTVQSYNFGQITEGSGSGSGFILTENGYVVTNYHVVEGGTSISVVMHDGSSYPASLVGQDSTNDVAVLKIEASGLPAVTLGSSSNLNVGDMVVAIGNPLGELNATQTVGYICGKDREVTTGGTIINMLQTDAAINPGNSGGPLFNMQGQVVGITTAKYSGTTSSGASIEGIGFAIPIDDVLGIIGDLQNYGYVTGAYMGVTVQNLSQEVTEATGIAGIKVISVEPGFAAEKAGLKAGDIITAVDGKDVDSVTALIRVLRGYKAGDTALLTIIRSGEKLEKPITFDEKPQDLNQPAQTSPEMPSEGNFEDWYEYFAPYFGQD